MKDQCPKCGAPCTTTVNMRGGDYGWGTTDAERTVYQYGPSPAASAQSTVGREDFDKLSADLTRAKNLLVRLHAKHPEARAQIEGSTGPWFVWGMDRDSATPSEALYPATVAQPVGWAAVHFGGKRDGKIYNTCDTRDEVDAYIQQVHQSSDSLTLSARPLVFADAAPSTLTDAELGAAAYKGFDDYWTEDSPGKERDAWTASAKAVLKLAQPCASQGCGGAELCQAAEEAIQWLNSWFRNHDGNKIADKLRAALSTAPKSLDGATTGGNDHG